MPLCAFSNHCARDTDFPTDGAGSTEVLLAKHLAGDGLVSGGGAWAASALRLPVRLYDFPVSIARPGPRDSKCQVRGSHTQKRAAQLRPRPMPCFELVQELCCCEWHTIHPSCSCLLSLLLNSFLHSSGAPPLGIPCTTLLSRVFVRKQGAPDLKLACFFVVGSQADYAACVTAAKRAVATSCDRATGDQVR